EHGPYIALQLVEAPTLRERLGEGELPLLEALRIAADVGRTLQAAHDARVVHGDLKPENIFLLPGGRTKLADFGAAVFLDERSGTARTRVRLGTPPYMAPEQIAQRAIDGRTDVYGLGCVLHEMLTGDVPFGRVDAPAELLRRQLESLPPRLPTPSFPSEVQRLLDRCLAKERADRHVSAEAFARAAERLADGLVHDAERG
ncbi:MAG: serine/threonine-protein kinase, partial [Myxococcota bacterium]